MNEELEQEQEKNKAALYIALDIRKFEIDLYWKRATYFWVFIGATFTAFIAIDPAKYNLTEDARIYIACFGIIVSFAWILVNRGSKFWQQNWEAQVDLLEDNVIGQVYKKVLYDKAVNKNWIIGSSQISVSKVNQMISFFVWLIWILLFVSALPDFLPEFDLEYGVKVKYILIAMVTAFACWALWYFSSATIEGKKIIYKAIKREVELEE